MNKASIKISWRILCLLAFVAMCYGAETGQRVPADEPRPTDYKAKAAYLYNFARFVEWPEDAFDGPQAPFIIGILGEDPFGQAFDSVRGKTVKGRTLIIKKIDDVRESTSCQILFIGALERGKRQTILKALQHGSVLTAGDTEGFAKAGGVVNFVVTDKSVGFEVNVDAAQRKRLKFSSRILNIAVIVHDAAKPEGE